MKMTERGQITIPKKFREKGGFTPNGEVDIGFKNGVVTVTPRRDMTKFDEAIMKWRGTGAGQLEELGFKNSDELIEALRGR